MKKNCLLLICFSAVFNVTAAAKNTAELVSLKEKVNHAIMKVEQTERELWSYKITRFEDEEGDISSSIEQYSPQAIEPWLLIQLNGQQATKKQIRNFAKKKQEQNTPDKNGGNFQLSLRELIDQESLSIISTDEKFISIAFNVQIKRLGKDSNGKLQGTLTYQKEQQFIEKISIWNNADFSPMLTANITDLALTFSFVNIDGAVLAHQNEMKMKGSFAYFTEINETSLDTYSDYVFQGEKIP
jgi:hypothetical protein